MLKKTISAFVIGLALAGCGTEDNGAIRDNQDLRSPNESTNQGLPEIGDIDTEGNQDQIDRNDDGGVNGNNGMNGAGDQGEIDGNVEEPNTDAINRTQDGEGLNNDRS